MRGTFTMAQPDQQPHFPIMKMRLFLFENNRLKIILIYLFQHIIPGVIPCKDR
jgi:hypothetical protein